MNARRFARIAAVSLLAAIAGQAIAQQPATTAFTYQGRLTAGGVTPTANYDFQFKLFDSATGGSQLGSTVALSTVAVSGGLFTANLDFGQQFNSSRRWLEIAVRNSGGGGFTTLSPRQELTAAPHAEGLVLPVAGSTASDPGLSITSTGGTGIVGTSNAGTFSGGLSGVSTASSGNGVLGTANTGTSAFGVWGTAAQGYGVVGAGSLYGGNFSASDVTGVGVFGLHSAGTGTAAGVEGDTSSTDSLAWAVLGHVTNASPGSSSTAVRGINEGTGGFGIGVWGSQAGTGWGVLGSVSGDGLGVRATAGTGGTGVFAAAGTGVSGNATSVSGVGVIGNSGPASIGVEGSSTSGGGGSYGVLGVSSAAAGNGVVGRVTTASDSFAVWGQDNTGASGSYAGVFSGNVSISGSISKSSGSFKIDHPLDPANKYLYHSFVESPDMMNVYNGNAQLDANGTVTVTMPDWFQTLNTEFRYQLTAIGAPGPNLYVAEMMNNNHFAIAGGTPGGMVSWQVTGVRQDPWAQAHRVPVEEAKNNEERGHFIHPELYGMPQTLSIDAIKGFTPPVPQAASQQKDPAIVREAARALPEKGSN